MPKKKIAKKRARVTKKKSRAKKPPRSDRVTEYAGAVIAGKIVAGMMVRKACERHLSDLKRADLFFDLDEVDRVVDFFKSILVLSDGQFEGDPFILELPQIFIVGSMFGWKMKPRTGRIPDKNKWLRRFRRCYIEMGKGNGKSPLLGGIGLYGMISDGVKVNGGWKPEAGAEIYSAAATKDQARILFSDAVKMVRKSPELTAVLTMRGQNPVHQITHVPSASTFLPISKESGKTGSGPRPSMALIDEVHEHRDGEISSILEAGFKFRRQPMIIMATNSGFDITSYCGIEHEHGCRVVEGTVKDDTHFAYICTLDPGDNPLKTQKCWAKANPMLGSIITKDYLAQRVKDAKNFPSKENQIRRLHFCEWTQSDQGWIGREEWEAIEDDTLKLTDFVGRETYLGIDLSQTTDLTAIALLCADGETADGKPKWAGFVISRMPKDRVDILSELDRAPYRQWIKEQWLFTSDGSRIDYADVAHDLQEAKETFDIKAVAYDNYLYPRLEDALTDIGVVLPAIAHGQGWNRRQSSPLWMPESITELETLVRERRLRVHTSPILRLAVGGARQKESPAGLRRWVKDRSTSRIDPLVSLTMAVGAAHAKITSDLIRYYADPDNIVMTSI